jgi:hypothetical protein
VQGIGRMPVDQWIHHGRHPLTNGPAGIRRAFAGNGPIQAGGSVVYNLR